MFLPQWTQLPKYLHSIVAGTPESVLLQTSRFDPSNRHSYLFLNPVKTIAAKTLDEIPELFRQIEQALASGLHVAGYLSYECGYHFERFEGVHLSLQELPLAWLGIYARPFVYDHAKGRFEGSEPAPRNDTSQEATTVRFTESATLTIPEQEYRAKILKIKEYIQAGETYQVNFTDSVSVHTDSPAASAFAALSESQPVAYSAFINVAGHHVLSLSPELFFRIDAGRIVTRPMKGTMSRGLDASEDEQQASRLQSDAKNRSEHVMIVDLLRNDLGRICTMGGVRVDEIFSIERYQTLLQMTSTISGTLRPGLRYYDIFKGVFPSGSITGAPKIRTMQIIREMERAPRGIYTGTIGFISPNGSSVFNVAIRTLVLKDGIGQMGVGGGIVADSNPIDEYRECLLKAEFLTRRRYDFQLIETMLWVDGNLPFLSMHLDRLESSAYYFDFSFDRADLLARIAEISHQLQTGERYRIRLLLDLSGNITLTPTKFTEETSMVSVRLSHEHTNSSDVFLRHKTTHRESYERQYAQARADGFDEVIFVNERDEVTEGSISNIFIRQGGKLLTPPLRSGVLPGIYRRHLLETNALAEERILTTNDLASAEAVFLCNSVRGLREVKSLSMDASPDVCKTKAP
ncbi:MAG: para-aminobenzoate synthase, subunit [Edaphobacter sp.]|nr:para-aminobenzoate synthase, subunit [Edaphobacter sp.]